MTKRPLTISLIGYIEIVLSSLGSLLFVFNCIFLIYFFRQLAMVLFFITYAAILFWLFRLGLAALKLEPDSRKEHIFLSPLLAFIVYGVIQWPITMILIIFFPSELSRPIVVWLSRFIPLGLGLAAMIFIIYYFSRPRVAQLFRQEQAAGGSFGPFGSKVFCALASLIALGLIAFLFISFISMFVVGTGGFLIMRLWQLAFLLLSWFMLISPLRRRLFGLFKRPLATEKIAIFAAAVFIILGSLSYVMNKNYQAYLTRIFTTYVADPVPKGVRLLKGSVAAWLDFSANVEFEADPQALPLIIKDYAGLYAADYEVYGFAKMEGNPRYYYKTDKKADYCLTTFLASDAQSKRVYANIINICYEPKPEAKYPTP